MEKPNIKTFKFIVSNAAYNNNRKEDIKQEWYKVAESKLVGMEEIDNIINAFIEENVESDVNIRINSIQPHTHNNGRCNTVELIYTLIYV